MGDQADQVEQAQGDAGGHRAHDDGQGQEGYGAPGDGEITEGQILRRGYGLPRTHHTVSREAATSQAVSGDPTVVLHRHRSLRIARRYNRSMTLRNRSAELFVRVGWGAFLVAAPGVVLRSAGGTDEAASRWVVRVLGLRHLIEAAVEAPHGRDVRRVGAAVDAIHAATALAFGLLDRRWRRPALADAMVAAGFAAVGCLAWRRP